jgi:hypothetical protein
MSIASHYYFKCDGKKATSRIRIQIKSPSKGSVGGGSRRATAPHVSDRPQRLLPLDRQGSKHGTAAGVALLSVVVAVFYPHILPLRRSFVQATT